MSDHGNRHGQAPQGHHTAWSLLRMRMVSNDMVPGVPRMQSAAHGRTGDVMRKERAMTETKRTAAPRCDKGCEMVRNATHPGEEFSEWWEHVKDGTDYGHTVACIYPRCVTCREPLWMPHGLRGDYFHTHGARECGTGDGSIAVPM